MPLPLNLNLLRSLEALLEARNLTRAADKLGLTQSAMSRHLVQLRAQFQDPLLLREGQRFVLTERAEELRLGLKTVLEQVEQLYQPPQFDPAVCEREFSFAGSDYLAEYMLPDILDRVLPQAPDMRLKFLPWQAGRFDMLVDGSADLVSTIADEVPDNIYGKSLGQDQPMCVMADDHPLRNKPALERDDYLAWPHARVSSASDKDGFVDIQLAQQGQSRQIRIATPYFVSALSIVSRSQLLLTLPEHLAIRFQRQFPVHAKPIPFIDYTYRYWLLWHGRADKDPAHRWFRGHVFDVLHHSIHGVSKYSENA
ncbi:LysR family transcriptional regulator [Chromobacterium piscinae]|uniref:LysR family transcriptional regulator n=1 Tax=Chromobacterium piscinae TaxID=686831 RepID=UPI003F813835